MISEMIARGQLPPPQQPLLFQTQSQRGSQIDTTRPQSTAVPPIVTEFYRPADNASASSPRTTQPMQELSHQPSMSPLQPRAAHRLSNEPIRSSQADVGLPASGPAPPIPPRRQSTASQQPRPLSDLHHAPSLGAASSPSDCGGIGNFASGSGNNVGYYSPASNASATDHQQKVTINSDADAIRPIPPARAPGHTYDTASN
jgi:hypothetical protein